MFVSVIAIWPASCSAAVSITRSFTRSLSLPSTRLLQCTVSTSLPVPVLIIGFGSGLVLAGSQVVRLSAPLLSTTYTSLLSCTSHKHACFPPRLPIFSFCSRPSCSFSVSLLPDSCYAYPYLARIGSVGFDTPQLPRVLGRREGQLHLSSSILMPFLPLRRHCSREARLDLRAVSASCSLPQRPSPPDIRLRQGSYVRAPQSPVLSRAGDLGSCSF